MKGFNFSHNGPIGRIHPMGKFLSFFIEKYSKKESKIIDERDRKFLNVTVISYKLILKQLYTFLYDKAIASRDSSNLKLQGFSEFLYDFLFVFA